MYAICRAKVSRSVVSFPSTAFLLEEEQFVVLVAPPETWLWVWGELRFGKILGVGDFGIWGGCRALGIRLGL